MGFLCYVLGTQLGCVLLFRTCFENTVGDKKNNFRGSKKKGGERGVKKTRWGI